MTILALDAGSQNILSEDAYRGRRKEIVDSLGTTRAHAGARHDQGFARLFLNSGWSVKELAKIEGRGISYISRCLLFARFLDYNVCHGGTPRAELSEGRFRKLWRLTDASSPEGDRFAQVAELLEDPPPPSLAGKISKNFADGIWRSSQSIAASLAAPIDLVEAALFKLAAKTSYPPTFQTRRSGASPEYRLIAHASLTSIAKELDAALKDFRTIDMPPGADPIIQRLERLLETSR